jgi:hypothetical protein
MPAQIPNIFVLVFGVLNYRLLFCSDRQLNFASLIICAACSMCLTEIFTWGLRVYSPESMSEETSFASFNDLAKQFSFLSSIIDIGKSLVHQVCMYFSSNFYCHSICKMLLEHNLQENQHTTEL